MNENHERHLLTMFRHIDNLLSEAEHILASGEASALFVEYVEDGTPGQRKTVHEHVERVRQAMRRAVDELKLSQPVPMCGAMWAAAGRVSFAEIAMQELEPKRMRGYGTLTEEDIEAINNVVTDLKAALRPLIAYLSRGPSGPHDAKA